MKKTVKKSKAIKKTAKKAVKKTAKKSISSSLKKQINEIIKIMKQLDKADIEFLLAQSQVLLRNKEVREYKGKIIEAQNKVLAVGTKSSTSKKSSKKAGKNTITIKEGKDNSYFLIRINNKSTSMVLSEMKKLVKLSQGSTDAQGGGKIYNWLKRERADVFQTLEIEDPNDTKLADLAKHLKKTYTTKS